MPDQKNTETQQDRNKEKQFKIALVQAQKKRQQDQKDAEEQERLNKERAEENNKKRCAMCSKEIFPNRLCLGHDLGGGGIIGSGGSGKTEEKLNDDRNAPAAFIGKLLLIDNNRDSRILTIKLRCIPDILSSEQKQELDKFIDVILKQLDEFKNENRIVADCVKKDDNYNVCITLPTPKLYDDFIKLLARKNLLPKQTIEQQEYKQGMFQQNINHFNSSFFSTRLTYTSPGKTNPDEKTSSIRPRSPLDG